MSSGCKTGGLIHVAAAALVRADGCILLTKRADHTHQGGLWEFPGGKLEPGETLAQGLNRELHEELGVRVLASEPMIRVHHDYGDRHVLLDVHRVTRFSGEPHGREGQPLQWLLPEAMDPKVFPAADRPIISALRLPDRMLITGAETRDPSLLATRLQRALEAGIRLVQLRAHELPEETFKELTASVWKLCEPAGAQLLVNAPGDTPWLPQGVGWHLSGRRLMACSNRPINAEALVGASCHDAEQLQRAADLGLDYALLSPVLATASHPDTVPLGWERFAELVDPVALPVYALGGMKDVDVARARLAGGQGVAGIRGIGIAD